MQIVRPGDQASADGRPNAPVKVVPYDRSWPSRYDAERILLEATLAPWLAGEIEHVGSTAVPGLAAKPIIDIMAPVQTLEASRPAIGSVVQAGYVHFPYRADVMHWFCKPSPEVRTHHLHLVPANSALWSERIAFRDALREDSMLAGEYARLKRSLAAEFHDDREAYTVANGPFVARVLSRLSGC